MGGWPYAKPNHREEPWGLLSIIKHKKKNTFTKESWGSSIKKPRQPYTGVHVSCPGLFWLYGQMPLGFH